MSKRTVGITLLVATWVATTAFYWVGYVGTDDLFYARYAWLFHRPPINWWEFRIPAILAIRGSFHLLGPTEFAAALPSLVASIAIAASVAWLVNWPRTMTWMSEASMLIAALIPIDAGFRSLPSANQIAAGLLAVGTAAILKGGTVAQMAGAALLAVAFLTHEVSFFYIAIFCLVALFFDPRRYWRPIACCVACSAVLFVAECAVYRALVGDALARFKMAAGTTARFELGVDPDTGISGLRFFAWPLQNLVLGKSFGFDLLALLTTGAIAWRRMTSEQRILMTTVFGVYFWLGYGSQVPWAYKPLYRQAQYYNPISLGVASLLPAAAVLALHHQRRAQALVAAALAVHVLTLTATGGYGENVNVSRALLAYAAGHPQQRFLTDLGTMNEMYTLNGFRLPANVVCLDNNVVTNGLIVNKEPPGVPRYHFPRGAVDGVLINLERPQVHAFEKIFTQFIGDHEGLRTTVAPMRYRPLFRPLMLVMRPRSFMILSRGGELLTTRSGSLREDAVLRPERQPLHPRLEAPQ
ncbi:MAG TPA: hypothetical protein VH458_09345 [Vicinamibacterales bacterium]